MQLYRCDVRHAGKQYTIIRKEDVTAADIVIMRVLHGADAVANIEPTRESRDAAVKVRARLVSAYGEKVFRQCYPGIAPVLPKDLAEAGLREDGRSYEDVEAEEAAREIEAIETAGAEPRPATGKPLTDLPAPSAAAQAVAEKALARIRGANAQPSAGSIT